MSDASCRRCPERKGNMKVAGRAWHATTSVWRTPGCRPGRIDHWMYEKDCAKSLLIYNQCSHYKPHPLHAFTRCTP